MQSLFEVFIHVMRYLVSLYLILVCLYLKKFEEIRDNLMMKQAIVKEHLARNNADPTRRNVNLLMSLMCNAPTI